MGVSMGEPGSFCRQCGSQLRPGARFCAACGQITTTGSQPATEASGEGAPTRASGAAAPATPGLADRETSYRSWPSAGAALPPGTGAAPPPGGGGTDALPGRESRGDAPFLPGDDELRQARSRWPLMAGLVVLLVAGLATATLLILH